MYQLTKKVLASLSDRSPGFFCFLNSQYATGPLPLQMKDFSFALRPELFLSLTIALQS